MTSQHMSRSIPRVRDRRSHSSIYTKPSTIVINRLNYIFIYSIYQKEFIKNSIHDCNASFITSLYKVDFNLLHIKHTKSPLFEFFIMQWINSAPYHHITYVVHSIRRLSSFILLWGIALNDIDHESKIWYPNTTFIGWGIPPCLGYVHSFSFYMPLPIATPMETQN